MNVHRPPGQPRIHRRTLLAAAGLTALPLSSGWRRRASAQSLAGTIRVGYDGANTIVAPFIEAAAAAVEAENPDARIELEPSPGGSYTTQLVLQLSGGRAPDVFMILGVGLAELANAGYLLPLDEFTAGWDAWALYPEMLQSAATFDGSVWTIPYLMDTHFLYYRRDIFERAGLPREWIPATPDDILAAARQIQSEVPEVIPYALYAGANGGNGTVARGFIPLVYAFGGDLKDDNGKWIVDSCAIRAALTYYAQAYQVDGTVPQEVMTSASPSSAMRAAMGAGELGILYEGCWAYQPWLEDAPEETAAEIGFVLHPTATDRSPFAVGGTGNSWFVNSQTEHADLAWAFITAFNTAETQVAINLQDPHIPARADAAADPAFQATPFLQAMVASANDLLFADPDPGFRQLVGIIQNATGLVATGEATPDEALQRYAEELTRVLGPENVVAQPCP